METSKANTTGSTNPHVRKQRRKTSQNKWWQGDAAAIYLLQSVQGVVLSKQRTSFKLLWKTRSGSSTLALEGQCQPRQPCRHKQQLCIQTRWWQFPVSDQCRSYPCLGLASLPESWAEPHSNIISHPHANHQIMPNSNLTSFVDEASMYFLNLRKHNNIHEKILFYTP